MASPKTLLPWLLGGAIGAAGILQGLQWKASVGDVEGGQLEKQLQIAAEENAILKRENESLRALAQGGGELEVPKEFVDRVEKAFELKFSSTPVIQRETPVALRDRISASIESSYGPSGADYRQEAYGQLGWLLPDDQLVAQLAAARSVGARSWFDSVTGEAWITQRFKIENIPDQAALVGLLSRILLHQNFPPPENYPGDDRARAREALHMGVAAAAESRFFSENPRSIDSIPSNEDSESEQLMASLSPFIQELSMFPVMDGQTFAEAIQNQGIKKLLETFRRPPQTTRTILHPDSEAAAPPELELPKTESDPFFSDRAGELGVRLWIEPMGDVGAASDIASFWKNDRYLFFPDGESSSAVMWDIMLESVQATDQLQSIGLDILAAMAGKEDPGKVGVPLETLENRFVVLYRVAPDRLRILNTASLETAGKFK